MSERFLEDFTVGQTFGSGRLRIEAEESSALPPNLILSLFTSTSKRQAESIFRGLAASGWHTAALTMRLLVESEFKPAGGLVGASFDELRWPQPLRPGDELHVETEILEIKPSKSRPELGFIKIKVTTLNQAGEAIQIYIANLVVPNDHTCDG